MTKAKPPQVFCSAILVRNPYQAKKVDTALLKNWTLRHCNTFMHFQSISVCTWFSGLRNRYKDLSVMARWDIYQHSLVKQASLHIQLAHLPIRSDELPSGNILRAKFLTKRHQPER